MDRSYLGVEDIDTRGHGQKEEKNLQIARY
jgi:hypothetical protein